MKRDALWWRAGGPLLAVGILAGALALGPLPPALTTDEWVALGVAYFKVDRPTEGRAILEAALLRDPANVRLNRVAGTLALQEKRYEAAKSYLEAALKAQPDDVETQLTMSIVYQRLKQGDRARTMLERIVAASPDDPRAYYNLAQMAVSRYNVTGARADLLEAKRHFERFLALAPADDDAGRAKKILGSINGRLGTR